jgi:hypothetical protein
LDLQTLEVLPQAFELQLDLKPEEIFSQNGDLGSSMGIS